MTKCIRHFLKKSPATPSREILSNSYTSQLTITQHGVQLPVLVIEDMFLWRNLATSPLFIFMGNGAKGLQQKVCSEVYTRSRRKFWLVSLLENVEFTSILKNNLSDVFQRWGWNFVIKLYFWWRLIFLTSQFCSKVKSFAKMGWVCFIARFVISLIKTYLTFFFNEAGVLGFFELVR